MAGVRREGRGWIIVREFREMMAVIRKVYTYFKVIRDMDNLLKSRFML